ncbi:hypothetical protein KSF_022130 [Reticulibacter mediterranei]|uniref:non-specific serine/threonine protein kinase n=1 Tax=Reticulibacter mediterranei TaxID=2778369 RepID=A0A8J3IGS6_9CHLR|nr:serine/threonine-protein kinase [Reticulibacter mediterranei]GHO92165.1 hypothetical protein KSF_022130 [Reticulibacter mediterranei]
MPLDGILLGHYRLLRLIGSGGMGEVYQGEDIRIARQVAIKVIRTETAMPASEQAKQEAERLFQREMHAIALLDHPHILPLYDFGEEEVQGAKLTYMVMPYRSEGSLTDWLHKRDMSEPLAPQEVAHILAQAASALQHAHDHQIVHQDVKPSNFLYSGSTHPITLLEDTSAFIQKGPDKLNTIAVKADRSAIYLYINHQLVNSTTDTTLDHGNIGFSAVRKLNLSEDTSAKVTYRNVRIWSL